MVDGSSISGLDIEERKIKRVYPLLGVKVECCQFMAVVGIRGTGHGQPSSSSMVKVRQVARWLWKRFLC